MLVVVYAVAVAPVPLGSVNCIVGGLVYPVPVLVRVKPVICPFNTVTVAAAPDPPPPVNTAVGEAQ